MTPEMPSAKIRAFCEGVSREAGKPDVPVLRRLAYGFLAREGMRTDEMASLRRRPSPRRERVEFVIDRRYLRNPTVRGTGAMPIPPAFVFFRVGLLSAWLFVGLALRADQVARADAESHESPIPVRLAYEAPDGCPGRGAFFFKLRSRSARIREAVGSQIAPSLSVVLRHDGPQVDGTLTFRPSDDAAPDEAGRREIRGADCESVAAGLALVASVILDPSAALGPNHSRLTDRDDVPPEPAAASHPASSHPVLASDPSVPATARLSPPLHLAMGAAFEGVLGQGPDPGFEPRAFVDVGLPGWLWRTSARVSVGHSYSRNVATAVGSAEITLTDVRLEPCVQVWRLGPLRLEPCAILEGGVLTGQGTNTNLARTESRGLFELGLGLRPSYAATPHVLVALLVAGAVPLTRYRFYFASPDTTAYRVGVASGMAELSVGFCFL